MMELYFGLTFWILSFACWYANMDFFQMVLGLNVIFASFAALFTTPIPGVGLILGIIGAHKGWGWSWSAAIFLNCSPTVLFLIYTCKEAILDFVESKSRGASFLVQWHSFEMRRGRISFFLALTSLSLVSVAVLSKLHSLPLLPRQHF